ncbi:peptidoglycan editing factor PgeF [Aquabacterium sp.]|uniref:peptidoglycan editing factor PgeF n=1 Tax=Aquabacterium sp. TaxID=1872578 RepID=UPI00378444FF
MLPEAALPDALRPDWPAPPGIRALMSTRGGGVSAAPFDSLNLRPPGLRGDALDEPAAVWENQRRFAAALGATPVYLDQVHGADVVTLDRADLAPGRPFHRADASITQTPGIACTVLVADCLPLLFCSRDGRAVGAAHAGWRGLAGGVIERTVQALCQAAACAPEDLCVWLGPCIGPRQFEVGADVLVAFGVEPGGPVSARFRPRRRPDGQMRWLADLPALARDRLASLGVREISGGQWCTVASPLRFFSFRRDRITGRMAAAIAIGH